MKAHFTVKAQFHCVVKRFGHFTVKARTLDSPACVPISVFDTSTEAGAFVVFPVVERIFVTPAVKSQPSPHGRDHDARDLHVGTFLTSHFRKINGQKP